MLVVADVTLDGDDAHSGHVDVPAVDKVAFGHGAQDTGIDGIAVDDFELGESDPLFKARGCAHTRYHHEFNKLLGLHGQLATLGFFEAVFGRRDVFRSKRFEELTVRTEHCSDKYGRTLCTHHLQLVLPKLLLLGLVEKGKLADMVDKDVAEDGETGVERRDLANVGAEGRAESAQGCRRVEF